MDGEGACYLPHMPDQFAESFTHLTTKDGRVLVRWHGQQIATVAGDEAARLVAKLSTADAAERQQLLARVTGNFKRGSERPARPK